MAPSVEGFADKEDGAAVLAWLVPEEVDGEAEGVEDGGAVVAEAEVVDGERGGAVVEVMLAGAAGGEAGDGVCGRVEVGGEVLEKCGLTVEGDDGDFVRDVADDRGEHWSQRGSDGVEFVEFAGAGPADFDDDDEGERLATGVLLESELLRDSVVGQDEIVRGECEDEIAGLIADESGRENKRRASAEQRGFRSLLGNGLRGVEKPVGRWGRRLREQGDAQRYENAWKAPLHVSKYKAGGERNALT